MEEEDIKEAFLNFLDEKEISKIAKTGKAVIDFSELEKHSLDLADELLQNGEKAYNIMLSCFKELDTLEGLIIDRMTFENLPDAARINIGDAFLPEFNGKLVEVEGMIEYVSHPESYESKMNMSCTTCGCNFTAEIDFFKPLDAKCPDCGNMKKIEKNSSVFTKLQIVKIMEQFQMLTMPARLHLFLYGDLTDATDPDKKRILPAKIFRAVGIVGHFHPRDKRKGMMAYMKVLDWKILGDVSVEMTENDLKEIRKLSKTKDVITKLVDSFCQEAVGLEHIRLSTLAQLVGGVGREVGGIWKRGVINQLLVGEPSTFKSSLANYLINFFPRVVYTTLGQASRAGLGLALEKDEELGKWLVKAGALVQASKGICIIDELGGLDKQTADDLKSSMEQGIVSLAKAGIVTRVKIYTPILGLMNPEKGFFDPYIDFVDQIKLPSVIISRMDIKWVLRDTIDEEKDRAIIKRMLSKDEKRKKEPPINKEFLLKYLLYARQLEPELTDEVTDAIENYGVDLRKKSQEGAMKIRYRNIEGMVRLSEAMAKLRLSKKVEMQDFNRAKELMQMSLVQFGLERDTGEVDVDKAAGLMGRLTMGRIDICMNIFERMSKEFGGDVPKDDLVKEVMKQADIQKFKVEQLIDKLLSMGTLMQPRPRILRKVE